MKLRIAVYTIFAIVLTSIAKDKSVPNASESTEEVLIRIERSWGKAMGEKDYKTVDRILAADWQALDQQGNTITKSQFMAELHAGTSESGEVKYLSIKPRLFGDFAIVVGSNTETSILQGKNTSGLIAWTDVFVHRDGRWQIVSSQWTKVK